MPPGSSVEPRLLEPPSSWLGLLNAALCTTPVIPWRMRHRGGPIQTLIGAPLRRHLMPREIAARYADSPDDITVLIGIRNRIDHKIVNTLQSVRQQEWPGELVRVLVIDYDSNADDSRRLEEVSAAFGARYLRIPDRVEWNRSHCMNIGIKRSDTKFLLSCDGDIILAPNYLSECVAVLKARPLSVVYSQVLDLGEETDAELQEMGRRALEARQKIDYASLVARAQPRSHGDCNAGINATYRHYYMRIQGYDEFYTRWGGEDNDIQRRFHYLGLDSVSLRSRSYYLHQWHPKHAGLLGPGLNEAILRNDRYFRRNHSIVRNSRCWGEIEDRRPGAAPSG